MTTIPAREVRVLQLEDVATDAELVQNELRKARLAFTAVRVANRDDFVHALTEFRPDLVLADFKLPNFSGHEALAIARATYPEIPFVIVTGALGDETAVELLRGGAKDYILKDRLSRLGPAVQRVLEDARAADARREVEARLRDIVEHSTNMFYTHTPEQVLTYVSPRSWQILDCSPEEALVRWTEFVTDNPVNVAGYESTQRAIDTGEAQQSYELELQTKKGRRLWVEVHEAPVVREGKTVTIVGAITDITTRKQAEAKLREQLDELRRFERVALGRELRMQELKHENQGLLARLAELEQKPSEKSS